MPTVAYQCDMQVRRCADWKRSLTECNHPSPTGQPSSATTVASNTLSQAEIGELVTLRAEVERLCRENKALRIENENMFWLAEEIKRLKAELKEARAQGGQK